MFGGFQEVWFDDLEGDLGRMEVGVYGLTEVDFGSVAFADQAGYEVAVVEQGKVVTRFLLHFEKGAVCNYYD